MKTKHKKGISIVAVLGLGVLIAASAIGILSYTSVMNKQLRATIAKQTYFQAEEILRTHIMLSFVETTNLASLKAKAIELTSKLSVPFRGYKCAGGVECVVTVKSVDYYVNSVINNASAAPTSLKITLGMSAGADLAGLRLHDYEIDIPLPNFASASVSGLGTANLKCPFATPLFVGTKLQNNTIVPLCTAISTSSGSKRTIASPLSQVVECNAGNGEWLKGIQSNLNPTCASFPEGIAADSTINLCPAGKYAQSFQLTERMALKGLRCVDKKGAYDL